MKKGSLMFSVEISHNILSYAPTRRGLRGGEIFDIAICEVKRRKGGLDLALADAPRIKFFLQQLCGNLYENKGPLWKKWGESGNVYENKGSYAFKAGIYMKTGRLMLSAEINHVPLSDK
jgi:hypothetical protein